MSDVRSVFIVAGGTGGHIFPAVVFGKWLHRRKGLSVKFLCGSRPLERDIYASLEESPFELPLEGSPLGVRSPVKMARRLLDLFLAWRKGRDRKSVV